MWLIPCWSPWRLALTLWHLASRRVSLSVHLWQIVFPSFFFPLVLFFSLFPISWAFDLFHTLYYTQRCQNIINMKESWEDSHIGDLTLFWNEWFCASYSELILQRLNIWDFQSKERPFLFCFFYPTFEILNPLFQNVIPIMLCYVMFLLVSFMFEFNHIIMLRCSFYRYKI